MFLLSEIVKHILFWILLGFSLIISVFSTRSTRSHLIKTKEYFFLLAVISEKWQDVK
jgi:hypothetical protein